MAIIDKKGIFFTFAAIVLATIIIFSFNVYNDYRLKNEMEVVEIRVNTMNDFIKELENDIENAIFISGFRSLLSLEDYMVTYDQFFNELGAPSKDAAFSDAFLKGTINSPSGPPKKMDLMDNNTFINWTERMKIQANKTGIELKFNVDSVTISQSNPWTVTITVQLDVDADDKKGIASWAIANRPYTGQINITTAQASEKKFVDPLYLVKNDGIVNNTITKTTVSDFGTGLGTHLLNSYYIEHSDAPSYLMRFENNLGSSAYGIESLVNSQELMDNGLPTYSRSAVDFIYFGTGSVADCKVRDPSYEWFRLDLDHLNFYEAGCRGG